MAGIAKKTKRYPSDLTDEEWSAVEPFLPKTAGIGSPRRTDLREVLNAVRYLVPFRVRVADVADPFPTLANGLLVVPPLGTSTFVSHNP